MKVFVALFLLSATCVLGSPISESKAEGESIDPLFVSERDTRFLLSTRQNRNRPQQIILRNLASITNSNFDRNRPTRFLIHGWSEDDSSDINTETSAELLDYYDFNVIFVDWSEGAQTLNYWAAVQRVPRVGAVIASQIDFMHQNNLVNFNRLSVIGFSLGAHIAGITGKNANRGRINNIVGLDPAGPLFSVRSPGDRIAAGDGVYVEAIHTNGATFGGLGIGAPVADADFFPNGGDDQPGCLTNACAHFRAVDYYVESIARNAFFALRCATRDNITSRRCNNTPGAWMGGDNLNFNKFESGSFYLETNRRSPFAQGPVRN